MDGAGRSARRARRKGARRGASSRGPRPPLGAHVSIAGGLGEAIARGTEIGCEAIQIFVKNANQWRGKPLAEEEAAAFRAAYRASAIGPLVAHSAYLINLAAVDPGVLARSRRALGDELDRCAALGVGGLVVHPGAHLGAGEEAGLAAVADSLDAVFAERSGCPVRVLLENTAGQGTVLGHRLEQLETVLARAACRERLGLCIDTCHAFAAGYAVDEETGCRALVDELAARFGLARVGCFHLNDSRHPRGSRRDRHANLGAGEIGLAGFGTLLGDRRLAGVPMIVETPRGDDGEGHRRDLERLRNLREAVRGPGRPARG